MTSDPAYSTEGAHSTKGAARDAVDAQRSRYGGIKWGAAFFGWLSANGLAVLLVAREVEDQFRETAGDVDADLLDDLVGVVGDDEAGVRAVGSGLAGSSRLTEKAMAEYHYVRMDLRNIGVLFLVLMGLLGVAYVLVDVLGIGKQI